MLQEVDAENADADLTADANKINEDYDNMIIPIEEEQNTVEYQETMKLYVKNIAKKSIWIPIYEVIHAPFLNILIFFHKLFKTYVKTIQVNLSFYHMNSK